MSYSAILYEKKGNIAVITLNQPDSMNSLVQAIYDELYAAAAEIEADDTVKAVIITGAGKAFCAGGDLKRFKEGFDHKSAYEYVEAVHPLCAKLANLTKPTIAAVNGPAVGAGLSVVLMCDLSIAADTAKLGSAYINMALIPDLTAAYFLPRVVGLRKAKELCMTGRSIDAAEALEIGLVNKVVPAGQLMEEALKLAEQLAAKSTFAMRHTKRLLNASPDLDFHSLLTLESYIEDVCFISEDSKEAVQAFLEKRKPVFKGR